MLPQPRFMYVSYSVYFTIASKNPLTVHQTCPMLFFLVTILSSSVAPMFILTANKYLLNANLVARILGYEK